MLPEVVARCLEAAEHGVVVLALDGLSHPVAAEAFGHARVRPLRSTFPSTSTTAWLTSVTGLTSAEHGVVGMVYRAPGAEAVTHLITGRTMTFGTTTLGTMTLGTGEITTPGPGPEPSLVRPAQTVFDHAVADGRPAHVIGAELERLSGPWVRAVLHGAQVIASPEVRLGTDPVEVVRRSVREVEAALTTALTTARTATRDRSQPPGLLWVYVNLDDHIHRFGYDERLRAALTLLDTAGDRWAEAGWTVLAHADHGQAPVSPRADLLEAWSRLDSPARCRMPAGGAGRVRWLYPRAGRESELADALADALGEHAEILGPSDLEARGLPVSSGDVLDRIGAVVAVAASPAFPVPDPSLAFEHGADSPEEMTVPLASWGSALENRVRPPYTATKEQV